MGYSKAFIAIPNVTGNIEIIVETSAVSLYTNMIPLSVGTDGQPFGTNGIVTNKRWNSSSGLESTTVANSTGLIPVAVGDIIRMQGVGLYHKASLSTFNSVHRIAIFNASKAHVGYVQPFPAQDSGFLQKFENVVYANDDEIIQMKSKVSGYIAVSACNSASATAGSVSNYLNENSIITINEPIILAF